METTTDEEAKAIIESLQRDVQEELNLHSSIMQVLREVTEFLECSLLNDISSTVSRELTLLIL